jgi:hypothetical protein
VGEGTLVSEGRTLVEAASEVGAGPEGVGVDVPLLEGITESTGWQI